MTLLTVSDISKTGLGNFKLQGISFSQRKNQKIAVAGETGLRRADAEPVWMGAELGVAARALRCDPACTSSRSGAGR